MKTLLLELRTSISCAVVLAAIVCGLYPLSVWGIAQALFPGQANGSLILRDGAVVGSSLIARDFQGPGYFRPRPSAAGAGFDGAASGGSNLGPISKKLLDAVADRVASYRAENGVAPDRPIPADAVTASSSGLDPHISVENARLQAPRVARARGLDLDTVLRLVAERTEGPDLGVLGETRVNVVLLNLDLDFDLARRR